MNSSYNPCHSIVFYNSTIFPPFKKVKVTDMSVIDFFNSVTLILVVCGASNHTPPWSVTAVPWGLFPIFPRLCSQPLYHSELFHGVEVKQILEIL